MASKKNIIVGAASVFIGPSWDGVTGSNPAPAVSGTTSYRTTVAATAPTWVDVGYTQEGVEVATDPSYGEVAVDQLLDAAKLFKDGMSFTISTTFAEATLENLVVAWGQQASTLASTATDKTLQIDGGSLGDAPVERGLIAVGNGPEKAGVNQYSERTYQAYRVLSVEGASHTLARADATVIPVSFRALPADTGKYGIVRDRNNVV
jgi:hypothetical protein